MTIDEPATQHKSRHHLNFTRHTNPEISHGAEISQYWSHWRLASTASVKSVSKISKIVVRYQNKMLLSSRIVIFVAFFYFV